MAVQFSMKDNRSWFVPAFVIWVGQFLAFIGSQFVSQAVFFQIVFAEGNRTSQTIQFFNIVWVLPTVLLGVFIGPLIDDWDRRKTMIGAQVVTGLTTIILLAANFLGMDSYWVILTMVFIRTVAGVFHFNSLLASISLMVPVEHLSRYHGVDYLFVHSTNLFLLPLISSVYAEIGWGWLLSVDVAMVLISVLTLVLIAIPKQDRTTSWRASGESPTYWQAFSAGFRYLWDWKGLLFSILGLGLFSSLFSSLESLRTLLLREEYGLSLVSVGILASVLGITVVAGSLTLVLWGGTKRRIVTGLIGIFIIGAAWFIIGMLPDTWGFPAMAILGISAFVYPLVNGTVTASLQRSIAPDMQGRIFTIKASLVGVGTYLILVIGSNVSDSFGIRTWSLAVGVAVSLLAVMGLLTKGVVDIESNHPEELIASARQEEKPVQLGDG